MSLLHKVLGVAQMVPGPQQPFVAGANAAVGLGEGIKKKQGPLWQMLMGGLAAPALDPNDPLHALLLKMHSGRAPASDWMKDAGAYPGMGGGYEPY